MKNAVLHVLVGPIMIIKMHACMVIHTLNKNENLKSKYE